MTPFVEWLVVAIVAVAAIVAYVLYGRRRPQLPAPGEGSDVAKTSTEAPAKLEAGAAAKPAEPEKAVVSEKPARVSTTPAVTEKVAEPAAVEKPTASKPVTEPEVQPPKAEAPVEPAKPEAPKVVEKHVDRPRDVTALKKGLAQTRTGWMQKLLAVFTGRKEIDPALLDEIEETLLTGDVGSATTKRFIDGLKERLDRKELGDADKVWDALKADALTILDLEAPAFGGRAKAKPFVILMVGVNGAGKTTTIAKLASRYKDEGKTVLLAAGDTFRAAAVAQLESWGRRVGVPVYKGKEGAKPGAVIYDAVAKGAAEGFDVVIADTAGRLQTKGPLMEELRKIRDACGKASPGSPHEVLLVLDATTGQNAISQAREFRETLDLTGVVLTKLDGTAKGGVILAVADEFKLPVRFVGVGEKSDDLREFDAKDFVEALFARDNETAN